MKCNCAAGVLGKPVLPPDAGDKADGVFLAGYDHWVRPHRGLRGAPGAWPRRPAMALGLTDHGSTVAELLAIATA